VPAGDLFVVRQKQVALRATDDKTIGADSHHLSFRFAVIEDREDADRRAKRGSKRFDVGDVGPSGWSARNLGAARGRPAGWQESRGECLLPIR
jgi:hypothetical protein